MSHYKGFETIGYFVWLTVSVSSVHVAMGNAHTATRRMSEYNYVPIIATVSHRTTEALTSLASHNRCRFSNSMALHNGVADECVFLSIGFGFGCRWAFEWCRET